MPDEIIRQSLSRQLGDHVHFAGSEAYASTCKIWNAAIDRTPAAVVPCHNRSGVSAAIRAGRACDLSIAVRGGGHNIAGTALADGALVIDLSPMRSVDIMPDQEIARVAGGATWADVDGRSQEHGLATPGGVVSSTGVGGLTLGGGFGWLARRHGLSVDNLLAAEIVLPDGEVVTVSPDENTELFWALRGGGGNFGIVTRFDFRLHQVGPDVLFGPTFFRLEDAGTVLSAYAANAGDLPRDGCVWANLMTAPPAPVLPQDVHGTKVLTLMQFFAGDEAEGRQALGAIYGGVEPIGSALAMRPFTEAQGFLDETYAFGARNYWRSHNHIALTDGLIDTLIDLAPDLPTPESELLICQLGGAVSDVPVEATAFPHRKVPFMTTPGVRWHDAADDTRIIGWLKAASDRIAEHAVPGAYANFIAETDGPENTPYGANLERLRAVKQSVDPTNLFRSNQNIATGS